jgi:hypothetical protein
VLTYILLGLVAKTITGLDDVITRIPILSSITKTRRGQIVFSLGTFLAILVAILSAELIAVFLKIFPYYRYFVALLLFGLAAAIYFDVFVHQAKKRAEKRLIRYKKVTQENYFSLFGIGFISSIATVLDDVIVFAPLFAAGLKQSIYVSVGIMLATVGELVAVILFADVLMKIKYKEKIASAGLILMGVLLVLGII